MNRFQDDDSFRAVIHELQQPANQNTIYTSAIKHNHAP